MGLRRLLTSKSEKRLPEIERRLKDEVYNLEHWSFADRPSEDEKRHESIYNLIRKVEELGGDVLKVLAYEYDYLAAEAMPETFERFQVSGHPYWRTRRISSEDEK